MSEELAKEQLKSLGIGPKVDESFSDYKKRLAMKIDDKLAELEHSDE